MYDALNVSRDGDSLKISARYFHELLNYMIEESWNRREAGFVLDEVLNEKKR